MLNKETIKSFLWDSAITDETVAQIEQMAIGYINSHLCYKIEEDNYIYEADKLPNEVYLPNYPVKSITTLKVNEGTVFNENLINYSSWYRLVGTAWKLITETYIGKPVKIEYVAWYTPYSSSWTPAVVVETDLPKWLQTAILELCRIYYKERTNSDIKSEFVDGDRLEFFANDSKIKEINNILDNYLRYDVVA